MKPVSDSEIFLATIASEGTTVHFRKSQFLFSQGDPADAVFAIQTGKVKLMVISKGNKEAIVAILTVGDLVGESCLVGQQPVRMSTASAMTECAIVRLAKPAMMRLLRDDHAFAGLVLSYVLTRNIRIQEDLVDQLFNSSEKRLARVLLLLVNFGKEGQPEVVPDISQETLAGLVGTTRSRVSFFMNRFRKLGFIDYGGGLEVHSSLLNVLLRDQPYGSITRRSPAQPKLDCTPL